MDNTNDVFMEKWESQDVQNIMNKVANGYKKNIDRDDIESAKMDTLWNCVKKYDETRGSKFTSYLYQQLNFTMKNLWKSTKKRNDQEVSLFSPVGRNSNHSGNYTDDTATNMESQHTHDKSYDDYMLCFEIVNGLDQQHVDIIHQRFYKNMTMKEIGKENGYSRETARRRVKNAIKSCKESAL